MLSSLFRRRRPLPACLIPVRNPFPGAYAKVMPMANDSPYLLGYRLGGRHDVICPFRRLSDNWGLWQAGRQDRKIDDTWAERYGRQRPARPRPI